MKDLVHMKWWLYLLGVCGLLLLLFLVVFIISPYSEEGILRLEAINLRTTWRSWDEHSSGDRDQARKYTQTNKTGVVFVVSDGKSPSGDRFVFGRKSHLLSEVRLLITEDGIVYANEGGELRQIYPER